MVEVAPRLFFATFLIMDEFKIYYLNENYYEYLKEKNLLDEMMIDENRPHIGFIRLLIDRNDNFGYVIPLTNDKNSVYNPNHKYSYQFEYPVDGKIKKAVLKINKMIPILNNSDFIIEKHEEKLSLQQKSQLSILNKHSHSQKIYELVNDVREKRHNFLYDEFKTNKSLSFAIDYPLADQLAINYAKNFYKPILNQLTNTFKELHFPNELVERKYFLNDSDWIDQMQFNKLFWPPEVKAYFADNEKYAQELDSKANQLLNHISNFRHHLDNFQSIENNNLMSYWFHKNKIFNQKSKFQGFNYQSFNKRTKQIENNEVFSFSKTTKFYFENEDMLIWYGWKNSKWPQVVLLNKTNNYATDMESIKYVSHLNTMSDFKNFIFQMFLEKPKEFQTILEKYGYPQNRASFFYYQINNINQQLLKHSKNPEFIQRLNQLKTMRESQLELANKEWQDYLQNKGLIDEQNNIKNLAVTTMKNKIKNRFSFVNQDNLTQETKPLKTQTEKIEKLPKWKQNRLKLVEQILDDIENKNFSWSKVWQTNDLVNAITDKPYSGVNIIYLSLAAAYKKWEDPRFLTFKQAKKQGWKIAKNAQSVRLEKWFFYGKKEEIDPDTGTKIEKQFELEQPICKIFYVFNAADCIGIPPMQKPNQPEYSNQELKTIYQVLKESSAIPVIDDVYVKTPNYNQLFDVINLPTQEQFDVFAGTSPHGQIATLAHEMAHSTGHPKRLNRFNVLEPVQFGSSEYAKEELVAGFSSIFLQARMKLKVQDAEIHNDTAYIQSWSQLLKKEPMALFEAAKLAEKAADFLYENYKNTLQSKYQNAKKQNIEAKTNSDNLEIKNNPKL